MDGKPGLPLTEQRNRTTLELDRYSALQIAEAMNREDKRVAEAVERELPRIAAAMELIATAMRRGGRLFYIGAGSSGRLGVLDASECPPTFGVAPELVVGLIAGGDAALRRSVEAAEDDLGLAARQLREYAFSDDDVLCGIAASGRTPYVLGGLREARGLGAATIAICCSENSPFREWADVLIAPLVGPEVLTGSTRLKAGSAQKMVLNMLSTGAMVLLGKTYSNLMVDLQPSNAKLRERCRRIVGEATGASEAEAEGALAASQGNTKQAILMLLSGISAEEAEAQLQANQGRIRIEPKGAEESSDEEERAR